jgi:hypothetical protein
MMTSCVLALTVLGQQVDKRNGDSNSLVETLLNLGKTQAREYREHFPVIKKFLCESDSIWTIATKDSPHGESARFEKFLENEELVRQKNSDGGTLIRPVDKKRLTPLTDFLRTLPTEQGVGSICFSPRNFVYAKRDQQWLKIAICYECQGFIVDMGDKQLYGIPNRAGIKDLNAVFGMPYQAPKR